MRDETLEALKAKGDQIKQKLNAVLEQDKKLGDEIQKSHYAISEVDTGIIRLYLCEQNLIILRPDQVYILSVAPDCAVCAHLAAPYKV